jgi:hypothetical protein
VLWKKKICTYLCAKNKGQERLYNLCRVRFIEVKMVKLDITGVESVYGIGAGPSINYDVPVGGSGVAPKTIYYIADLT